MRAQPAVLESFRAGLREAAADILALEDVEIFAGPNLHADFPCAVWTYSTPPEGSWPRDKLVECLRTLHPSIFEDEAFEEPATAVDLAKLIAAVGRTLASEQLGIELRSCASAASPERVSACLEIFPCGSNFRNAQTILRAMNAAMLVVANAAGRTNAGYADAALQAFRHHAAQIRFDPETLIMIAGARAAGLPILLRSRPLLWQYGWGLRSKLFWQAASNEDGFSGFQIQKDKALSKIVLQQLGLPTPDWRLLRAGEDPQMASDAVGFPCVVKPLHSSGGKGVAAGLVNGEDYLTAVGIARKRSANILVEQHLAGRDYRLLVIDGRMAAAVVRNPPTVRGDGSRTISELIEEINRGRRGAKGPESYLFPIVANDDLHTTLAAQGLSLTDVLPDGLEIALRSAANHSGGGTAHDVTEQVHPDVRRMAELLANATGLRAVGVDYMSTDIGRPPQEVGGGFIELNTTPGLLVHAAGGRSPEEIGRMLLGDGLGRIPAVLIVASDDAAVIADLLKATASVDCGTGVATAHSAYFDGVELVPAGQNALEPVETILILPQARRLLVIWSERRLLSRGLPLDRLDLAIVCGSIGDRAEALLRRHADRVMSAATLATSIDEAVAHLKQRPEP